MKIKVYEITKKEADDIVKNFQKDVQKEFPYSINKQDNNVELIINSKCALDNMIYEEFIFHGYTTEHLRG